ncbi:heavy metal translocating P-type ATPase [Clostridium disporicum]|uniref:Cation-transporting ATPase n=1 Tax=Clostridium disporicum TaxID=84024 RepID=A0A174A7G3_9CLOT|nr:heavy metal translocating P-type ATPase [Clostridium disporicum]CUN84652.1 cation-transporting ATPase [Clostridium disporicum]
MEIKLVLNGLDCANCANKIEDKVNKINGVKEATVNFSTTVLTVEIKEENLKSEIINEIKSIVKKIEPHVKVEEKIDNKEIKNKTKACTSSCCSKDNDHHEGSKDKIHEHSHEKEESSNGKIEILKDNWLLIVGAIIYAIALLYNGNNKISIILFVASYLAIGGEVILTAIKNILRGEVFDENFLMSIATIGAFFIGEYPEAVAVMLFYQIGEVFQGYAVNKSRKSISSLMNIRADYANVLRNGIEFKVSPEEVNLEEIIVIKPGERVPLDGTVIEGTSFLDTSALTGESVPREVKTGDEILSGAINDNGVLKVKVNKEYGESTVARILELVENASNKKAPTEKFITKFSKVYTPIVVFIAIIVAIVPPLLIKDATFSEWLYKALSLLVVSCPCALVVSIPLGVFSGIGAASKKGILVKGGNYLEALKESEIVVFDKTGTLTKGVFKVTNINAKNISEDELLEITAIGESNSNHPIALSIANAYGKEINKNEIESYKEVAGHGVEAIIKGKKVLLGNSKLMKSNNISYDEVDTIGTIVHIAIDGEYKGNIVISDEVKENVKEALTELKSVGIKKTIMLTGDSKVVADKVAKAIGIDEVHAELLPSDKVNKVEEILNKKSANGKVLFVGDGINDAPVLARADIGIAMGGVGSDAAIEAADVVLMKDKVEAISEAIRVSRKTSKILWQNIIFSLAIKVAVMILVIFGLTNMWAAVFADVGVTLLAVLNSMRIIR